MIIINNVTCATILYIQEKDIKLPEICFESLSNTILAVLSEIIVNDILIKLSK